ncbi:helix-turn-helix transcriptional regulator [Gammaproteobacteria bacterium AS21]
MASLAKEIGRNIKLQRVGLDISQAELAFSAQLNQSYLSKIENGAVNISVQILYNIAEAMNCDPHKLLPKIIDN